MQDQLVLRVVTRFLVPFIIMFGLYVQLHGEYSPGGGFQAGVIIAAAFIAVCLIWGYKTATKVLSIEGLRRWGAFGVLLYAGVGVANMLLGGQFLEYSVLADTQTSGQKLGILLIELGVGITVFSMILLLFYAFVQRKSAT